MTTQHLSQRQVSKLAAVALRRYVLLVTVNLLVCKWRFCTTDYRAHRRALICHVIKAITVVCLSVDFHISARAFSPVQSAENKHFVAFQTSSDRFSLVQSKSFDESFY